MKKLFTTITFLLIYSSINAQIKVSETAFSDNVGKYINKTITLTNVFYADSGQPGSYSDVRGMTLRSKGNNYEDMYSVINFSFTSNDGADKYYCRTVRVDGNDVTLHIPKSLSNNMPNTTSSYVNVTGVVKRYNLIEVKSIKRASY